MITNMAIQNKPEHKQMMHLQSWCEPALRTLDGLLEIRRANLRKVNGDEKNAAVTRDEFMEMLINEHRVSAWYAGEIISSLHRAGQIFMFGRFIQMNEEVCVRRKGTCCQLDCNEARAIQRLFLDMQLVDDVILQEWISSIWSHHVIGNSLRDIAGSNDTSVNQIRQDLKCGLAYIKSRHSHFVFETFEKTT